MKAYTKINVGVQEEDWPAVDAEEINQETGKERVQKKSGVSWGILDENRVFDLTNRGVTEAGNK